MRKTRLASFIAVIFAVLFIGSVFAYADTWPPLSVVASNSMTHSANWTYGTLNVGDTVFVKKVPSVPGNVITYVVGRNDGYRTYGNYGNVIIYDQSGTDIIHRAIFYLTWNNSEPVVQGYKNQSWLHVNGSYVLIDGAGYNGRNLYVNIGEYRNISGFFTAGDHNVATLGRFVASVDAYCSADQNIGIASAPINNKSIVGIAFWDIPWFGLIKLNLMRLYNAWPYYNEAALNSYLYLGISMAVILTAIFFPYDRFSKRKRPGTDK